MRIHIHGRGSISAAGNTPSAAWEAYELGAPTWRQEETYRLPVYETRPFSKGPVTDYAEANKLGRTASLALFAAQQAVTEAGWHGKDFAILVGCSRGPTGEWEKNFREYSGSGRVEPRTSPTTTLGSIGFALGEFIGNSSLASSLSVTCSSGMHALLHGIALLESGMAEHVLVGGAEAPLTAFTLQQMQALRIYATLPARDQHACKPLATPASGMVVGEGAAFLALSKSPRHLPSGATSSSPQEYPLITGLGFSRESGKTATGISPEGDGLQAAMGMALTGSELPDFIVAHAPGTAKGDQAERQAITRLLPNIPVTSFKWATGHTFGASGPLALDAAISSLLRQQFLPLQYLGQQDAPKKLQRALVNATGFGGNAVSVQLELEKE